VDSGDLANFTYTSTPGNPSTVEITFTPTMEQLGNHVIHVTASDSFSPPGVTTVDLTLCVDSDTPVERTSWGRIKALYQRAHESG
jgi:hypothetical protein